MILSRQFLQFALIGALGTALQYVVLWFGVTRLGMTPPIASGAGFLFGSVMNYLLNYRFTFRSGQSHMHAAIKYYLVLALGLAINTGCMELFVRLWHWNYWFAQCCTSAFGLIIHFIGNKLWVFERTETSRAP